MPDKMLEIVTLIDISSFGDELWSEDLIEHITEAVSFQISRDTITNRKLIHMGFEPYLGRVKWAFSFVDATSTVGEQPSVIGRPLEALTHEHWDLFIKDMHEAVKLFLGKKEVSEAAVNTRMTNLMEILKLVKFSTGVDASGGHCHDHMRRLSENCERPPDVEGKLGCQPEKVIFVFTSVPKVFSSLIHLARNLTLCRHFLSRNFSCAPEEIQICLVDLHYDVSTGPGSNGSNCCFWDELNEGKDSTRFSLKISSLKKILMIHKLEELRRPWNYEDSARLTFGFGMGMKRLRQLEWAVPRPQYMNFRMEPASDNHCLPLRLRRCWSDEQ